MAKTSPNTIRYEVITQHDEETDDMIIPIPLPLLKQLNWKEGDQVEIGLGADGKIFVRKASK